MMQKLFQRRGAILCGLLTLIIFLGAGAANFAAKGFAHVGLQEKQNAAGGDLAGTWQGALDVGAAKLRLTLHVTREADGSYRATLDSLDQDARGIPVESVTLTDAGRVRLELKSIGGSYEGTLSADKTTLTGSWSQGGPNPLPLVFRRSDAPLPGPKRPQEPQKPLPYAEEEVSYDNKPSGGTRLNGTLSVPRGQGPHPAVVLITGSGMQDRNESVAGHKPFLVLADHLARQGIAVLRADDRGFGGSPVEFMKATSADFADDALAGVAFLKARKEIDPGRIGLIGHSEGGIVAPLAALKSPDVRFLVLLAGPGVSGEELLLLQSELIMKANGADEALRAQNKAIQQMMFAILRTEKTDAAIEARFRTETAEALKKIPDEQKRALGITDQMMENQIRVLLTPWYRFLIGYDPRPALTKIKIPVLAVTGERDLQVPPKENLAAIASALKAGGNRDYQTIELPQLNHLFQTSRTGSPAEYSQIEETFAPQALKTISDWILRPKK